MSSSQTSINEFLDALSNSNIRTSNATSIGTAVTHNIACEDWKSAAQILHNQTWRWSALWADQFGDTFHVYTLFEKQGCYMLMQCELTPEIPSMPSIASVFPAANRMERHTHDMYGIEFQDAPDKRRWTRHQAWDANTFPLSLDFTQDSLALQSNIPADTTYHFFHTAGSSVYEIPVGPIHAGIIESGHFRIQALGETVLNLEERLAYTHKGTEKLAQGCSPEALLKLAARVSGDSSVAHSWAAAMAVESALNITVPQRALYLRAILLERERIANHIGDIGGICNDVGFAYANSQSSRLREIWQRQNDITYEHRLLMDSIIIGGVKHDLTISQIANMLNEAQAFLQDFDSFTHSIDDYPTLDDRLTSTGKLPKSSAIALGCLGYVARGSGIDFDVRRNASYAPYDHIKPMQVLHLGEDVLSRLRVRVDEIRSSIKLITELLQGLPEGDINSSTPVARKSAQGIGIVEGWRGETVCYIRLDKDGTIQRYFPKDPSWNNWLALECLIDGNIVADFPVSNKSVNGSYSGVDL